jgi:hypothetical protein
MKTSPIDFNDKTASIKIPEGKEVLMFKTCYEYRKIDQRENGFCESGNEFGYEIKNAKDCFNKIKDSDAFNTDACMNGDG